MMESPRNVAKLGPYLVFVQDLLTGRTKWINCSDHAMAEQKQAEELKALQERFVVSIYKETA